MPFALPIRPLFGCLHPTSLAILLILTLPSCNHRPPSPSSFPVKEEAHSNTSREVEEQLIDTLNEARKLGPQNPLYSSTIFSLAMFYREHQRFSEAETLYQELLSIKEMVNGPNHPDVAFVLEEYASLLRDAHRSLEAEWLTLRAQTIRSSQHP